MFAITSNWSPALALVLFAIVDFVLPAARQLARTGSTGITVFRDDPVERVVGAALLAGGVGLGLVALLFGIGGHEAIGAVELPSWVRGGGLALILLGVAFVAVAQAQMGTAWRVGIENAPTDLVTHGLYARVRNPIYTGMLVAMAGAVATMPALSTLFLVVEMALWVALQTRREEAHLTALHGEAFRQYAARAGRFFPRLGLALDPHRHHELARPHETIGAPLELP